MLEVKLHSSFQSFNSFSLVWELLFPIWSSSVIFFDAFFNVLLLCHIKSQ